MVVRHRQLAALALVVALASCDAPTVPEETFAYDPRLPGGLVYHWPLGATISVYVDPAAWPASVDPDAAVRQAFAQWEDVTHYRDYDLRIVTDPARADVIIHHRDAPLLVDVSECSYPDAGSSGVTFFCPSEALDSLNVLPLLEGAAGRVKMDVRVGIPILIPEGDIGAYVAHEIGHVLGIGAHSLDNQDLMFVGELQVDTPSARDARTLRWVLRQPVDVRP